MSPPATPIQPIGKGPDDVQAVGPLGAVQGLVDLLRRERIALSKLDKKELEAIADGGAELLDSLRGFIAGKGKDALMGAERDRFSEEVKRLVAEAHVNAMLLHDARSVLAAVMGTAPASGTYDARGRLSTAVSSIARKLV
jgi:hypothetical protein